MQRNIDNILTLIAEGSMVWLSVMVYNNFCESVRYFVTNRQVLTQTDVRIKRKANVTQIDLKNFAWNIAFQYNIGGDITAQFVMQTFNEWFANSTLDTIRKNLRTTTGRRKIEICETLIFS